jgi:hypothetical protein
MLYLDRIEAVLLLTAQLPVPGRGRRQPGPGAKRPLHREAPRHKDQ